MTDIGITEVQRADMATALALLKHDLGIRNETRDEYFLAQLLTSAAELRDKGILLDPAMIDDNMLLSDYTVWRYRMRMDDAPAMSQGLRYRILNRIAKGRAKNAEQEISVSG